MARRNGRARTRSGASDLRKQPDGDFSQFAVYDSGITIFLHVDQ